MSLTTDEWASVAEVSDRYGLDPSTVRRWISKGQIRAIKFGPKLVRVELASVEALARPLRPVVGS